jgi:hypothetical protein
LQLTLRADKQEFLVKEFETIEINVQDELSRSVSFPFHFINVDVLLGIPGRPAAEQPRTHTSDTDGSVQFPTGGGLLLPSPCCCAAASPSQNPRRTSACSALNPTEPSMAGQQWRVAPRMARQHSGPMYDSPFTRKSTISLVHDPSCTSASQHSMIPPPSSSPPAPSSALTRNDVLSVGYLLKHHAYVCSKSRQTRSSRPGCYFTVEGDGEGAVEARRQRRQDRRRSWRGGVTGCRRGMAADHGYDDQEDGDDTHYCYGT